MHENKLWILGRLLRDHETPLNNNIGLHIRIFKATTKEAGKPQKDLPLHHRHSCHPRTSRNRSNSSEIAQRLENPPRNPRGEHFLALLVGTLLQWRSEKWAAYRKNTMKKLIVTGENGTSHVMAILGNGKGMDLEDLGAAETPRMKHRGEPPKAWILAGVRVLFRMTQFAIHACCLGVVFLITLLGLKENAWYVLAIGRLGMVQNVVIARASHVMGTTGIHLEETETFEQTRVMDALVDVQCKYNNVGKSLVKNFSMGGYDLLKRSGGMVIENNMTKC